jgi:hypothetical protein
MARLRATSRTVCVMSVIAPTLTLIIGAVLGAWLARRNEQRATADQLLLATLSDVVDAIAAVSVGAGENAQQRYASATSRLALHASPEVVAAFRRFQDDATTATADGRARFLAAVQAARRELGSAPADNGDLTVLLWGPGPPLDAVMKQLSDLTRVTRAVAPDLIPRCSTLDDVEIAKRVDIAKRMASEQRD